MHSNCTDISRGKHSDKLVVVMAKQNPQVWADTLGDNGVWNRNDFLLLKGADPVPQELIDTAPFGYGASVFNLGKQSDLDTSKRGVATLAKGLARSIAADDSRLTRVQVGAVFNPDVPVSEADWKGDVLMTVWAVDDRVLGDFRQGVQEAASLAAEKGCDFNMQHLAQMQHSGASLATCTAASRRKRSEIALNAAKAANISIPPNEVAADGTSLYDVMNFETVALRSDADGDNTFHVMLDSNHPSNGAAIFHSPSRGVTFYPVKECATGAAKRGIHMAVPASDGRCSILPEHAVASNASDPETVFSSGMPLYHVASASHSGDRNVYNNIECYEAAYRRIPSVDYVQHLAHCDVVHTKAIATAVASSLDTRTNGLYGHLKISNLEDMVTHIHPDTDHVYVNNTLDWQKQLTEADPQRRPYRFMSEKTAVADDASAVTAAYKLDKAELRQSLMDCAENKKNA